MAWLDFDGPDPLGFGRSDKPDVAYTLELYARFVERIVDDLDLAPVTLVGACVGSAAGLRYTYEHPDRGRARSTDRHDPNLAAGGRSVPVRCPARVDPAAGARAADARGIRR